MAREVLDPTNPLVDAILLDLRPKLRLILIPGSFGDIVMTEPAPVHDGLVRKIKLGFIPTLDLTSVCDSARKQ